MLIILEGMFTKDIIAWMRSAIISKKMRSATAKLNKKVKCSRMLHSFHKCP